MCLASLVRAGWLVEGVLLEGGFGLVGAPRFTVGVCLGGPPLIQIRIFWLFKINKL